MLNASAERKSSTLAFCSSESMAMASKSVNDTSSSPRVSLFFPLPLAFCAACLTPPPPPAPPPAVPEPPPAAAAAVARLKLILDNEMLGRSSTRCTRLLFVLVRLSLSRLEKWVVWLALLLGLLAASCYRVVGAYGRALDVFARPISFFWSMWVSSLVRPGSKLETRQTRGQTHEQLDDKTTGEKTRPSSSSSGHETRPKTRFEFEELQHFGEPCGVCGVCGVCGERCVGVFGVRSCA